MKDIISKILLVLGIIGMSVLLSCNDYLDREPISQVSPEQFFTSVANLDAYVIGCYGIFPTHGHWDFGTFGIDQHTDNMAGMEPSVKYAPGVWLVPQTGGSWWFNDIYKCNYFFEYVLPRWEKGQIEGNQMLIRHDIGEMYFIRAFAYFERLKLLGDFPILTKTLPDNREILNEASKRMPRNEVARFILRDIDSALVYLMDQSPDGYKNRLNKNCAYLFKSRVALFEGTWLKYFKGTAFVPNGPGWPGKEKEYNANYQYPSGNIDSEIDFFLGEAMNAAKVVADNIPLEHNTGKFQNNPSDPPNPYFDMFGAVDMSKYSEVLFWRRYDEALGVTNNVEEYETRGNRGIGTTRSMIDAFIMEDGRPIYRAEGTDTNKDYLGDTSLYYVTRNRDSRAQIFIKIPGQNNLHTPPGDHGVAVEPGPDITATSVERKYTTGYAIRKGLNFDGKHTNFVRSTVGSIIFRATEAYLNYIEACYEKTGALDATADIYWKAIRNRAKINPDYDYTIGLTDMTQEGKLDWGAYSGGQLVDPTLYNIRRERRCELMAEGLRDMDLKRWRSMDQLISNPYYIEGFNLWDKMYDWDWYKDRYGHSILHEGGNVSSREFGKYLQPYRIKSSNIAYNGYRWAMAHYLDPIAIQHILNTSQGGDLSTSPIYQNPGWPYTAGGGASF